MYQTFYENNEKAEKNFGFILKTTNRVILQHFYPEWDIQWAIILDLYKRLKYSRNRRNLWIVDNKVGSIQMVEMICTRT